MAKRVRNFIVALILVITLITAIAVLIDLLNFDIPEREAPDMPLYYMGNGRIDLDMPGEGASEEEVKAFVVDLYNLACANFKAEEKAAFEVRYTTTMYIANGLITIPIPGSRYSVKDGDKRYYLDFTIPSQDMIDSVVDMNLAPPKSSHYAEAVYTDATMDYMVSRKAYKDCAGFGLGSGPVFDENGAIVADWDYVETTELNKIVYAAYQDGEFRHTDHEVSMDTILTASVSYSEYGYYICEFTLDPNKVPEALLNNLRESSGQPSAVYTELKQTMTVWDTGYLRTYHALDYWEAGGFMSSELDFETIYYYENEPEKVDINNYPYMAEMCHA